MYRHRYINILSQFGRTSCTLILDDLEGNMPTIRLEKEFNMTADQLDNEILYQEASKEIRASQQAYDEQQATSIIADETGDQ
jgi:hypothetical protein